MCGAGSQSLDTKTDGETVIQGVVRRGTEPAAGAYVRLLDQTGEFTAEVVTSATGGFRFFARPGQWTVRALAPGGVGEALVKAAEGEVTEVSVAL